MESKYDATLKKEKQMEKAYITKRTVRLSWDSGFKIYFKSEFFLLNS
jgi:hypothetical protein